MNPFDNMSESDWRDGLKIGDVVLIESDWPPMRLASVSYSQFGAIEADGRRFSRKTGEATANVRFNRHVLRAPKTEAMDVYHLHQRRLQADRLMDQVVVSELDNNQLLGLIEALTSLLPGGTK